MSYRHAPALQYPVTGAYLLRRATLCAVALVALILLAWVWQLPALGVSAPLLSAVWMLYGLCVSVAIRFVWRMPQGRLQWDGAAWQWCDQCKEALHVHCDIQVCMLLSLRARGHGHIWLWLERRTDPARWGDLRRAVYSRPRPRLGVPHTHADAERGQA